MSVKIVLELGTLDKLVWDEIEFMNNDESDLMMRLIMSQIRLAKANVGCYTKTVLTSTMQRKVMGEK